MLLFRCFISISDEGFIRGFFLLLLLCLGLLPGLIRVIGRIRLRLGLLLLGHLGNLVLVSVAVNLYDLLFGFIEMIALSFLCILLGVEQS